eukprot:s5359_g2.t4
MDRSELPWPSRALCYHGCFLSLAAALRAFSSVCDLLVPGQGVTLIGLQTALGQQLNGAHAVVQHFHAQTGRFAVCLKEGDPPSEWKKIRPQNLQADPDPSSASSIALQVKLLTIHNESYTRRACLESVAEIFDDLLLMIHDEDDDSMSVLHSHLSASMWEALMQCVQDRSLGSSALLDLCSNNATLCSVLARHIFSVPVERSRFSEAPTQRVLRLQEGFARAYCRLYQPDALWDASLGGGIAELQVELDGHVLNLAAAAVQLDVLESFIQCCDIHVAWFASGGHIRTQAPAVVVLLCRWVCTLALACSNPTRAEHVRRHLLMLIPDMLSLVNSFVESLMALEEAGASSTSHLLALQSALDAVVALVGLVAEHRSQSDELRPGDTADSCRGIVEGLADRLLRRADVHAAVLARLALCHLGLALPVAEVLGRFQRLEPPDQALFLQQACARSRLLAKPTAEVHGQLEDAGFEGAQEDLSHAQHAQPLFDLLMEQCIEQLPSSPQPSDADDVIGDSPLTAGMLGLEEQVSLLHFHTANETEKPNFLGALDLPALPSPKPGRRTKKHLGRSDIARLRGDPVDAPEELRCAIDGKLMAVPLVSPHGHVFEHETLLQWLSSCGSICPITGKPLREEDCEPAVEIQQKVLDWVKAARSSYKRRLEEKRRRRVSQEATTEIPQGAD